jgi:hypothetical protein
VGSDDPEIEEVFERWRESARRSTERRSQGPARRPRHRRAVAATAAGALAVLAGGLAIRGEGPRPELQPRVIPVAEVAAARVATGELLRSSAGPSLVRTAPRAPIDRAPRKIPSAAALDRAWEFAQGRDGVVSFAVVNSEGKLRGRRQNRRYAAASTVKAMLLAAEIRRLKQAGAGLDPPTDSLLTAMITWSDNDAADAIYARVGDGGLLGIARRAGMTRFTVAGHWGNAQVAAGDLARFFGDLDRVLVRRYREYAKGLLGSIVESQRWGIPAAAGDRWAVRFKGGWLPDHALAHQAAELRERHGPRELSIAVLTDDMPSFDYATDTVREVADRLLSRRRGGP